MNEREINQGWGHGGKKSLRNKETLELQYMQGFYFEKCGKNPVIRLGEKS